MATIHGVVLIFVCFQAASALRIGNYPHSRANQTILPLETQMKVFTRIYSRYDIVAVPNIFYASELRMVEEILKQHNSNYRFYLSTEMIKPTLPLTNYYGVFYKSNVVSVSDFVRDQPTGALAMRVRVNKTGQEFAMSIVHLSGTKVLKELKSLPSAFQRLRTFFKLENVLFVGDFNTFPHFIPKKQFDNLMVTKDPQYTWFMQMGDNTFLPVVSYLHGPAARFLASGDIANWVVPSSAKVIDTMEYFNLTLPEAAGMGIFRPVELELREPILRE